MDDYGTAQLIRVVILQRMAAEDLPPAIAAQEIGDSIAEGMEANGESEQAIVNALTLVQRVGDAISARMSGGGQP